MKSTDLLRISQHICFLVVLTWNASPVYAQDREYPAGYFRNPVDLPLMLAGNFGECRTNHFHSGLDIKTEGKENYPIYAAAEGYVSRIRMDKGGFGHCLYVDHPNGYTTVYAHLNDFAPAIQQYMKHKQYELESWQVDLKPDPGELPVKKGEQIAWSGNTGSSTAPHLHFEIRDTRTEHPVNPQLFGFNIKDTRAPVPTELAVYDLERSIFLQQPKIIQLKGNGPDYHAGRITAASTKLGISIHVNDFMDGSRNTLNFYTAAWYLDDSLQGQIRLEEISYDVTRYLHAYVDYRLYKQQSKWFQLLFRLPGNQLPSVYPFLNDQQGALALEPGKQHELRIVLKDAQGNTSTILLNLTGTNATETHQDCLQIFEPGTSNSWEHPNVRFRLSPNDLYDASCFSFDSVSDPKSLSRRYRIHTPEVPVHNYFDLYLKPDKLVPFELRPKVVLRWTEGRSVQGKATVFQDGWYLAPVRNFGTFWLEADTTAPVITPLQPQGTNFRDADRISFRVKEDLTSVAFFRAELVPDSEGGPSQWLAFEPRGDQFFYIFDEHCPPGNHRLKLTVRDESGNSSELIYRFKR